MGADACIVFTAIFPRKHIYLFIDVLFNQSLCIYNFVLEYFRGGIQLQFCMASCMTADLVMLGKLSYFTPVECVTAIGIFIGTNICQLMCLCIGKLLASGYIYEKCRNEKPTAETIFLQ